ncbi:UNKNOWN [Stylonychia lemnae]|uniref:Uncharacterized protein n=1 Tax=Stylonychia lemnae TaxID=5949 RepID=A0A078BAV3_STYLE|nr:UNKNOWN [Stylonychia lemnae]|eukprot:CDW90698.1 UNKNOWN [Stylonychia lemnae]
MSNRTFFQTQQAQLYNLERLASPKEKKTYQQKLYNQVLGNEYKDEVIPQSKYVKKLQLKPLLIEKENSLRRIRETDIKPQVRSEAQRKLDNLQRNCLDLSFKMHKNLNELQVERDRVEQLNESFDNLVDDLKGLEGIEANVISTIYQYKKLDKQQMIEESKFITQEYKSGVRDPARIVARMEKSTTSKKKYQKSKRQIVI